MRGMEEMGEEQVMKMLPGKSKNCLEPRGLDLVCSGEVLGYE